MRGGRTSEFPSSCSLDAGPEVWPDLTDTTGALHGAYSEPSLIGDLDELQSLGQIL